MTRERRLRSLPGITWVGLQQQALVVSLAAITLIGAGVRFWALGEAPPGLYHDEAYNGIDALAVLAGARPVFFEANNGREPLYIYLSAVSVSLLGQTPMALRVVAAILGTLTIPATFLLGRALFSARVGLLGAAVMAISVWPINLSRVGFRAVGLPLVAALCAWQAALALRTGQRRHFVAAGVLYGAMFYTYLAARFTPLVLGVMLAVWLVAQGGGRRGWRSLPWRRIAEAALVAAVVVMPLAVYLGAHSAQAAERGAQVSIMNPAINGGDPIGLLGRQIVAALAMFHWRGDFIPRHNVPLRPVFDPLVGLAALGGVALIARRWRQPAYALVAVWTAVMLLPTIMAEGAPHFLRAVGVLPAAMLLPALGLDAAWRWLTSRGWSVLGVAVVVVSLAFGAMMTGRDYFLRHSRSEAAYYQFETGAVELAATLNRFLGAGWDGSGWSVPATAGAPDRRAYVDARLWDGFAGLRFLASDNVRVLRPGRSLGGSTVLLALWPFEDHSATLAQLPRDALIEAWPGAYERGDLETEARLLYTTVRAEPALPLTSVAADFGVAALARVGAVREAADARVRLVWRADGAIDAPMSAFVHAVEGGTLVGQADGPPGGLYPARLWRAGDYVAEERLVPLAQGVGPVMVRVGLYDTRTLARLGTITGADYVEVPAVAP